MINSQDRLEYYKNAVRLRYESEKNGEYSSFLFNPSRAKLRDLCRELFNQNLGVEDLKTFRLFFGFEYNPENFKKLKDQTDKFRPIESFFKGESDLSAIEGINLAAILVDFKPRPFARFLKQHSMVVLAERNLEEVNVFENEITSVSSFVSNDGHVNKEIDAVEVKSKRKSFTLRLGQNKIVTVFLIIASLLVGFSFAKFAFPEKQCMQWQNDRYEAVDCIDSEKKQLENNIIPLNEALSDFRRVEVSDTTVFFTKHGKPLYWYCKVNGKPEFFNDLGNGQHPESGNVLKPVTNYIVKKYVLMK